MQDSIAPGAIRISLFQTVPGKELEVAGFLKEACKREKIRDYVFFKALGTFDIALIYVAQDFEVSLGPFGPIPNILKSNHLLCYSYKINPALSLIGSLKGSNLMGLSLLKIDPWTQRAYPGIEGILREFITQQGQNWALVGSIGWNEIIMIVMLDDINSIVEELINMSTVVFGRRNIPVLAKTLSLVCLNYRRMPTLDVIGKGMAQIRKRLNKYPYLRRKIGKKGVPSVEITAKPMYAGWITDYFTNAGFRGCNLLGKLDLSFKPLPDRTWADCLGAILDFRHNFPYKAFSTNTRLKLSREGDLVPHKENPWNVNLVNFSYQELEKKYGERAAIGLANHFYSFNSLVQNPIYGSAFLDMADYPKHVLKTADSLDDIERINLAHGAREELRYGSELRLCGTFQSIEEETGKFSEIQGGGQRALLALEYIPYRVLRRLKLRRPWSGFIVTSHNDKLMHINEVIQVPIYTLWKPQTWWTLYHEIAHIWIDISPEVVSFKVPAIEEFLVNKNDPRNWLGKLMELAAEIIGFEIGFFGDYKLFFKLFWSHIRGIDPTQMNMFNFGDYAMRSFFTLLFHRGFGNSPTTAQITKKDFMNIDLLYQMLLNHLEKIETTFRKRLPDKHFWAAEKAKQCSELYGFASHLAFHISKNRIRISKEHLNSKNTEDILQYLSKGRIWWGRVNSPEAVIYRILQLNDIDFKRAMATVITFWNKQVAVLKKRFR